MTYRDDRDATLARAEALEQDLKRAEAERDQLKAEIERLEHLRTTAPPLVVAPPAQTVKPVNTIVRVHTQALTPTESKSLLAEVEVGLARAHGVPARSRVAGWCSDSSTEPTRLSGDTRARRSCSR